MMKYKFTIPNPSERLVRIELVFSKIEQNEVLVQLPSWRPGRYELGNFAKNIHSFTATNENNETLPFRKITKDCWKILTTNHLNTRAHEVKIQYSYYASQPDAGGCWVDEDLFYINPIHCCLYVPELIQDECIVELHLRESLRVATALEHGQESKLLRARNYHELVDSPIFASASLQHNSYEVENTRFNLWFHGDCTPDWGKIINDFRHFTNEQIHTMGESPVSEYHFLVLALPYKFYHGVEHLKSTVLAFGPGNTIMNKNQYPDFIGLASHELFHVWNVKTIRPHEMMPYDYTKENYSRLGFVYEGVTTYYGDLFLVRSGVYTEQQFFKEISSRLQKHLDNYGRFNLSVSDSSFDTWLDGYTPGIPWRKTSIYDEGCLIALMCDLMIRRKTNNEKSLDDVMRILFQDFGKHHIGYTERDYITIIENLTNESVSDFFIDYVYGTEDYEPLLQDLLDHFGCTIAKSASASLHEHHFGFKVTDDEHSLRVKAVAPGSPAILAGLGKDDEIMAVNERRVENNLDELIGYFFNLESQPKILLKVSSPMKKVKTVVLEPSSPKFFPVCKIEKSENTTSQQQKFFNEWLKSRTILRQSLIFPH